MLFIILFLGDPPDERNLSPKGIAQPKVDYRF